MAFFLWVVVGRQLGTWPVVWNTTESGLVTTSRVKKMEGGEVELVFVILPAGRHRSMCHTRWPADDCLCRLDELRRPT